MTGRERWMPAARAAAIGVLLVFLGCSSSSAPGTSGMDARASDGPASGVTRISAAKGGTVKDPAGNTTLTIPAGALAEDTDISLQIVPKYAEAVSPVSIFGPDGLTFSKPAVLSIKGDAALAPGGQLVLAVDDGGTFVPLAGSAYANGAASAPIMHFTAYGLTPGPKAPTCAAPSEACGQANNYLPCCKATPPLNIDPECNGNTYRCCVPGGYGCTQTTDCCGDPSNLVAGSAAEQMCQGNICCSLIGYPCGNGLPCCAGSCIAGFCQ